MCYTIHNKANCKHSAIFYHLAISHKAKILCMLLSLHKTTQPVEILTTELEFSGKNCIKFLLEAVINFPNFMYI